MIYQIQYFPARRCLEQSVGSKNAFWHTTQKLKLRIKGFFRKALSPLSLFIHAINWL